MTLGDDGAASVEYAIVLSLVVVGCVIAVIGIGPLLVSSLRFLRAWLLQPFA